MAFALRFCSALAKHLLERIRSFRFVSGVLISETSQSGLGVDAIDFDDKRYFSSHAHYTLEILDNNVALQMKTLFLGFSLGVSIWLWNARKHQQSRQIFR